MKKFFALLVVFSALVAIGCEKKATAPAPAEKSETAPPAENPPAEGAPAETPAADGK